MIDFVVNRAIFFTLQKICGCYMPRVFDLFALDQNISGDTNIEIIIIFIYQSVFASYILIKKKEEIKMYHAYVVLINILVIYFD